MQDLRTNPTYTFSYNTPNVTLKFELRFGDGITNSKEVFKDGISIYPNPTTGIFVLDLPTSFGLENVSITDITGKIIYCMTTKHAPLQIDLTNNAR